MQKIKVGLQNMLVPNPLSQGDTIAIVASARFVTAKEIDAAINYLSSAGFRVKIDNNTFAIHHQFAGSDALRAELLQNAINDPEVKAIWFARGGYGTGKILDIIDWTPLLKHPKWFVGFSDITILHLHLYKNYGLSTMHAPMALQFDPENSLYSGNDVPMTLDLLQNKSHQYILPKHLLNREGDASGNLIGGNLSVIYSCLGSDSMPETSGCILFLEDLDEYLYHIDRMMLNLDRNGVLDHLSALIVGGMTDMNDNAIPFGKTAEEIILDFVAKYNYPVYFGFQAGHCVPNNPLRFGQLARIENNTLILPASNT